MSVIPALAARWTVCALDFRGHGASSPAQSQYRVIDYVDDVEALLQTLDEPAVVFGHSLGAMVAVAAAARVPNKVRALILEDPPLDTMGERIADTVYLGYFREIDRLIADAPAVDELARSLSELRFVEPVSGTATRLGDVRDPASLRFAAASLLRMDRSVLAPIIERRWLEGFDRTAICRAVRCPTLLLQADLAAGGMLTEDDARRMQSEICDCHRVPFAGAGHLLHSFETPSVLRVVTAFLESLRIEDETTSERTATPYRIDRHENRQRRDRHQKRPVG
jgi:pimeloyl-ACP methyl ester carboxylesterase